MGGTWSIKLTTLPATVSAGEVESATAAILESIESQMSTYRPAADVSRFNAHRGGDWFPVGNDLAAVVAEARRVSEQTGGAFDVTVGPLVNLWGFGAGKTSAAFGQIPDDAAIAQANRRVGYAALESRLDPPALRKARPDLYVDLGGIAQGYAADRVAEKLAAMGIGDYLVEVCGEMRAAGRSPAGRPWRVGIETPTPDVRRVLRTVELADLSFATSGDYRNFFDRDGKRYSHEIDPRTGRPITGDLASVSVAHGSAAHADAMATALMVLGYDAGYETAVKLDLAVLLIRRGQGRFETRETPAFARLTSSGASLGE